MSFPADRFHIVLLYAIGVVQGLTLVIFPAASPILTSPNGFGLSGTQYGAMFIPQVLLAILTAGLGGVLSGWLGLRKVLQLGLCANLVSMLLLALAAPLAGSDGAFVVLCLATGALGLGFGMTTMTLNTLVPVISAPRQNAAMLTLNALLGLGTALAPLLLGLFNSLGAWWALPALTVIALIALLGVNTRMPLSIPRAAGDSGEGWPVRFWMYAAVVLLYGVAETLTGNWATLYLTGQRQVAADSAALALSAFWIMLTSGRMLFAGLARVLSVTTVFIGLPLLLALSFQFVALAQGLWTGVAAFGLAGLACSAILPLSLSFVGREFPDRAAGMVGSLIACYQLGYGIAAFGGGPLVERAGLTFSTVFSLGGIIALVLWVAAVLVTRPLRKASIV